MTKKHEALIKKILNQHREKSLGDIEMVKVLAYQEIVDSVHKDLEKYFSLPHIKKLFDNKSQL
jgi:hypothetical protein